MVRLSSGHKNQLDRRVIYGLFLKFPDWLWKPATKLIHKKRLPLSQGTIVRNAIGQYPSWVYIQLPPRSSGTQKVWRNYFWESFTNSKSLFVYFSDKEAAKIKVAREALDGLSNCCIISRKLPIRPDWHLTHAVANFSCPRLLTTRTRWFHCWIPNTFWANTWMVLAQKS